MIKRLIFAAQAKSPEIREVVLVGNTALLGAKMALFSLDSEDGSCPRLRGKIEHLSLKADVTSEEVLVEEVAFPQHSHVQS